MVVLAVLTALLLVYGILLSIKDYMFLNGIISHTKGSHYLGFPFWSFTTNTLLSYGVRFSHASKYDIINNINSNKIFGISLGGFNHHKNSVRFIWRYYEYGIQLGIRRYKDGVSSNEFFETNIKFDETYYLNIIKGLDGKVECSLVSFDADSLTKVEKFSYDYEYSLYSTLLYPYFGGEEPAPKLVQYELFE